MNARRRPSAGFVYPTMAGPGSTVYFDGEKFVPETVMEEEEESPKVSSKPSTTTTTTRIDPIPANNDLAIAAKDKEIAILTEKIALAQSLYQQEITLKNQEIEKIKAHHAKLKVKYKAANAELQATVLQVESRVQTRDQEVSLLQSQVQEWKHKYSVLESQLDSCLSENTYLKENLEQASSKFQRMKEHDAFQQEQLLSQRVRADTLERVLLSSQQPWEEVLIKVVLPNGKRASFLVNCIPGGDPDLPKKLAEAFALQHRLGIEATRVLVAFALAECAV